MKGEQNEKGALFPLHKLTKRHVQTDKVNCGICTCLFSYGLLTYKDKLACEGICPKVRYWIAQQAMNAPSYPERNADGGRGVVGRACRMLWDDTECTGSPISLVQSMELHEDGQFASLSRYVDNVNELTSIGIVKSQSKANHGGVNVGLKDEGKREFETFCDQYEIHGGDSSCCNLACLHLT